MLSFMALLPAVIPGPERGERGGPGIHNHSL